MRSISSLHNMTSSVGGNWKSRVGSWDNRGNSSNIVAGNQRLSISLHNMFNSMVLGNVLGSNNTIGNSSVVAGVVVAGQTVGNRGNNTVDS